MTKRRWSRRDANDLRAMYERLRRFAGAVGPWELEPEDLLQEALVRVLQGGALSRFDRPEAYLRRTIVNLSHNYIRRRHNTKAIHATIASTDQGATEQSYPSDLADLLAVDPRARAVLYLHDVERFTFSEISDVLGMQDSTCRQIASRARTKLRQHLEEEVRQ